MTDTLNSYFSNSIASSVRDGQLQLKGTGTGNPIPIMYKNTTNFVSVFWSKQNIDVHTQPAVEINKYAYKRLAVQADHSRSIKVLPVVTPPSCSSIAEQSGSGSGSGSNGASNFKLPLAKRSGPARLNKFVRRLHDMLQSEQDSGIVEWRKGLLVLHSTDTFTKEILPTYFGTKNFKTFRRQLNYYGFVHVRSFSATGSTTTALWVNQDLARRGTKSISSVLMLKRVEPSESSKTAEGRRVRKEEAANTVEDIGISTRSIHLDQIRHLAHKGPPESEKANIIQPINATNHEIVSSISLPTVSICQNESMLETSNVSLLPLQNSMISVRTITESQRETTSTTSSSTSTCTTLNDTTTDDAANLLIMLSKSAF
mmetsp:Transcript_22261/g.27293  ORF Transcript_22261/g.27293 Transcript_22261/m.27293 type:complete len:371 (+) Transcript_22261:160-1272(+)